MNPGNGGWIALEAPAKVNLYLHVVGRRSDGFHLLDTLMVFTALADRIEVAPSDNLDLDLDGPFAGQLPKDANGNLVIRAARALAEAAGVSAKARIRLIKNLPVSAGLGSGSSDAAATLKALSQLLVNPGVQLATASVFSARRGGFSPEARFEEAPRSVRDLAELLEDRTNDLSDAAATLSPVVMDLLREIEAAPGCRLARMSGSGATCFGLFDDAETAERAAETLRRRDWWCAVTRFGG
jgi:4-diphosphocytidyl-2-C-methyl-D-erythritol kinase